MYAAVLTVVTVLIMPDVPKLEDDHLILAHTIERLRISDSALNSLELRIQLCS